MTLGHQIPCENSAVQLQDRDIVTGRKYEPRVDQATTAHCASLGPSILLTSSFYEPALALHKPVYAWVVDSKHDLERALALGLHAVVSNIPLSLQATIEGWQSAC